jgi:hypothetical protein
MHYRQAGSGLLHGMLSVVEAIIAPSTAFESLCNDIVKSFEC